MIEIMIVVVIIGILASIALPSYSDYVIRGRIPDATSNLSALAVRMEQAFQDNRNYYESGSTSKCAVDAQATAIKSTSFDFSCTQSSATAYILKAKGKSTMAAFEYTIDQAGNKKTVTAKAGWSVGTGCWTTNKSGC